MRIGRTRRNCGLTICTAFALAAVQQAANASSRELFIGNSLTFSNNLPALVGQMRSGSGEMDYFQRSSTVFGVGLDWHWTDARPEGAHALLAPGGWDGVVLQDLSFNPTDNPNQTRTYVRLWNTEIKAKAPAATTYLFAPWERQDRLGSTLTIESVYGGLGAELDATLVPVGRAWKHFAASRPDIQLYTDVVHPTVHGTYIAAATFYGSFFGQSPVGLFRPPTINATDALDIQNAAWDVVSGRLTAADRSWAATGSGDWNDSENWGPAGIPAAGDRVTISASDGISRVINYSAATGASTLLGNLTINSSIAMQHSQSTLRVAGHLVLAGGSYQLSGSGRVFAARDVQINDGQFVQHGGHHVVLQKLTIGGESSASAAYLLNGGLISAKQIQVRQGGTFTQNGGTLDTAHFHLAGGKVQGILRNRGVFEYSAGQFHGKLINEGTATLAFNPGKIGAAESSATPQMEIEVSGEDQSLVTAQTNQDLKSLVVQFANAGTQGFDLASGAGAGDFRSIRVHPGDSAALASAEQTLSAAIAHALSHPGDGIYDSRLAGRAGTRIGLARRVDVDQNSFLLMRPTVIGDLNLDGSVSIADFIDLAANFDASDATWDMGDLNWDRSVSIADFIELAANFGRDYSGDITPISLSDQQQLSAFAATHVPEPAAFNLGCFAVLAGMKRRSRHKPPRPAL